MEPTLSSPSSTSEECALTEIHRYVSETITAEIKPYNVKQIRKKGKDFSIESRTARKILHRILNSL